MKTATALSLILAAATLSACGGTATVPTVTKAQAHLDAIAAADIAAPATAVMPVAGTAMYAGTFGIGSALEPNTFAVGDATIQADFAAGTLNGTAGNFIYGATDGGGFVGAAVEMEGNLTLSGGFVGTDGLLGVDGMLDGEATTGLMLTQFKGDNAETLLGLGTGQVSGADVNLYLTVDQ